MLVLVQQGLVRVEQSSCHLKLRLEQQQKLYQRECAAEGE